MVISEEQSKVMPLLVMEGVTLTRPGSSPYCLEVPELSLQAGGWYSLTGASGSGKSTALDIISMILRPSTAEYFVLSCGGERLDIAKAWQQGSLDALGMARAVYLGYVLQTGGLMPFLTVEQNILLPRVVAGLPGAGELESLSEILGISHLLHKNATAISVGERQRTSIARALIHDPLLIIADEPTAALDPHTATEVMSLLIDLSARRGVTLLVASHDWDRLRSLDFEELSIRVDKGSEGIVAKLRQGREV